MRYSVRYESDGEVCRYLFEAPGHLSEKEIITKAAGVLFLSDCCPGEPFCVYINDDRRHPVGIDTENGVVTFVHHYYGDRDSLWKDTTE